MAAHPSVGRGVSRREPLLRALALPGGRLSPSSCRFFGRTTPGRAPPLTAGACEGARPRCRSRSADEQSQRIVVAALRPQPAPTAVPDNPGKLHPAACCWVARGSPPACRSRFARVAYTAGNVGTPILGVREKNQEPGSDQGGTGWLFSGGRSRAVSEPPNRVRQLRPRSPVPATKHSNSLLRSARVLSGDGKRRGAVRAEDGGGSRSSTRTARRPTAGARPTWRITGWGRSGSSSK